MRFENPFSAEDLARAAAAIATPEMYADAYFVGAQAYVQFVEEYLKPQIHGLVGARTPREEAVLEIHYGIVGFLVSLNMLRNPWNVQAISSCSRSIFELYTDLLLLHADDSAAIVERFHAFVDVEKLRVARTRLEFFDAHPELPHADPRAGLDAQREFVEHEGARIEADVARLWDRWPRHWSGIRELRPRAAAVGVECEGLYWQYYAHLSWLVHTASVGTLGLKRESIHLVVANALELVRQTVVFAFDVVARELHFDRAIEGFGNKLDFLKRVFFFRLTALQLGTPDRFSFLDPLPEGGPGPEVT